ncbi:hypothetical protein N7470_005320 [Penicillium chermesinum]|nr:hypothetical protein N7470_005320 [Penicillium chermesinum]
MTITGSCLCGSIQYSADVDQYTSALCHCTDCQKLQGDQGYVPSARVHKADLSNRPGTPSTYDVTGNSGKINKHFFCSGCGSSLYTELEIMPDSTVIKAGGLDNGAAKLGGKIDLELYVKDRVPYLAAAEGAKQQEAM